MRFFSYLTTLLIAVLLVACGGGGGSAGTSSGSAPPALATSAPSALTLPIGVVQTYSISGGFAPYTIKNSNASIAAGFLRGGVFTLNPVSQGQATVTIVDDKGTSIPIDVTVGADLKLSMATVQSFVGDVIKATITGGTPPYRTSTIDLAVTAVVNGNQLIMTLNAVGGPVDVVVLDANDQQVKLTVTIINGTPQIRVSPNTVTVSESDTQPIIFTIFGAVPGPVTVTSSDPTLLQASVSGNTVTVVTGTNGDRCVNANTTVNFQVTDSRPSIGAASVTIANSSGGCSGLTAPAGDFLVQAGTTRSVVLGGDAQTGYSVSSENESVATATFSNGVLSVTGVPAVCTTTPPATVAVCVPAPGTDKVVEITVTDIAHPSRFVKIKVTVKY